MAASVEAIKSAESPDTRYKMYDLADYTNNFYSRVSGISDEAIFQPPMTIDQAPMRHQGNRYGLVFADV